MRARHCPTTPAATVAVTAVALALAVPAQAQQVPSVPGEQQPTTVQPQVAEPPVSEEEDPYAYDSEAIVVTGVRRGTVIGDIPPENQLDSRDVRATGATDITELLEALAPQLGSARGRGGERPVTLLNGQRVSSFRELRDIPTEAIERVEILPEEVALKYGYSADQRVVNIVLRERFRSTTGRLDGTTSTEGGYTGGRAEVTQLQLNSKGRTTVNLRAEGNTALTEDERDIDPSDDATAPDERSVRTLWGSKKLVRAGTTINRTILGDVGATLNTELEHSEGRSLFGLSDFALEPLVRNTSSNSAHIGVALNGNRGKWRWSLTGNGDAARSVTRSDRKDETRDDRVETLTTSGDIDLMGNGPLFSLPAGDVGITVRVGASTLDLDNDRRTAGKLVPTDLNRTRGSASANLDLPVSRRNRDFSALGNLTLNANAEVEQLSDFGTLTTVGAGANWSPIDRLNFLASWTREEGAPSIQQLGDPILITPDTRVFDFTTGETVLVTATTGGNPDLLADRRRVLKLGTNWKPLEETDLRFRAEYVRSRLDRPVSSFPGPSETLEDAFPERFIRAAPLPGETIGPLVSVDLRPVNYDEARRDTIRWGIDFTKPLRSRRPSQAAIEQLRRMRAGSRGEGNSPGQTQAPTDGTPPQGSAPAPTEAAPVPRGFGRRFGGGQRGRLQFSLTHTINLVDEVTIRPGLPELDYLHGDALGSTGGRPRHQIEAQAGYFNNGLGARLGANWRSGTRVDGTLPGDDLRFSPLATFDLRLFSNFGEMFDLVARHPWLRGASLRFEVRNVFDSKPRVRNADGLVPTNYQADLLDPLGRTVSISIRKLFLPRRGPYRRPSPQPSES